MAAIGGGSEIIIFGGWRREELGDVHVLSLGGLDEERYMLSRGREEQDRFGVRNPLPGCTEVEHLYHSVLNNLYRAVPNIVYRGQGHAAFL